MRLKNATREKFCNSRLVREYVTLAREKHLHSAITYISCALVPARKNQRSGEGGHLGRLQALRRSVLLYERDRGGRRRSGNDRQRRGQKRGPFHRQ